MTKILTAKQTAEVIEAMSSPLPVSFDFHVNGSSAEKVVVHERCGEVLVWMQCNGLTHSDERYGSRSEFIRAALATRQQGEL